MASSTARLSLRSRSRRRALRLAAVAAVLALGAPLARAQPDGANGAWPTRPVRIVVGFPGGSTPDMAARTIAAPLAAALGQPVVIENRPGASGNVAADIVAKATDGHTLGVVINGNLTTSKLLNPALPFDPATAFAPISLLTTAPLLLVGSASQPEGAAFIEAARKAGDQWNYGSPGNGSVGHLGMELLKAREPGVAAVHVPYQGNPQVAAALLSGEIHMALVPPGIAMPHVKAGKLHAIGVTSGRSVLVPEVPPLADAGLRDFTLEVWTALVAPARMPKATQERLAAEVARIVREPDTRQKLFQQGWQAVGSAPQALATRVREETAAMKKVIESGGIKLE
jgi:tripartite-type tricarboxylate transporter receptor subunit TctC